MNKFNVLLVLFICVSFLFFNENIEDSRIPQMYEKMVDNKDGLVIVSGKNKFNEFSGKGKSVISYSVFPVFIISDELDDKIDGLLYIKDDKSGFGLFGHKGFLYNLFLSSFIILLGVIFGVFVTIWVKSKKKH